MNQTRPDWNELMEFPCQFTFKIFGEHHDAFAQNMQQLMLAHDPAFEAARMEIKASRNARYLSVSCQVNATSVQHLEEIYQALSEHPMVKMVL